MSTKSTRKKVIKKTKTDIEFEKAKRNVKMIGVVATIFLFILVIVGFLTMGKPSYAALLESLPASFTSKLGKSPKCTDNQNTPACNTLREIGTIDIDYGFKASYDNKLADLFCIEHMKSMSSSVDYTKDKSVLDTYPGIVYILDNNNFDTSKGTCKSLGTCTDSQLNEYLTQIAIWWYIDKVNGCDDSKNYSSKGVESTITEDNDGNGKYDSDKNYQYYNNLSVLDKQAIKASKYASKIDSLVNGALAYKGDTTTPNISLPSKDSITYTIEGDNIITSAITPTSTSESFSSYTVTPTDTDIKILNTNLVEQTTFGKGESFIISAPMSTDGENKMSIDVTVEGSFSKKDAFFYKPTSTSLQTTVLGVINNSKEKANLNLTYQIDFGVGEFRKVDAGTGKYVENAVLSIIDSKGITVSTFETIDAPTYVWLPVGNYTVTETKIPDGYSAEKTTYEFEIKKDETTVVVLNNTKLIDVPNTKASMSYIYGIGAAVVVVGIIFIVIAKTSSNGKKKKN